MAHTFGAAAARASSASNPITFSHTITVGETVMVLLLKTAGGTDRAGGAPTWGGYTFTQANTTQKAVTSPECGAELWYVENPLPRADTVTIPNTGAATVFYRVVTGRAAAGGKSKFCGANGGNATGTNPSPGAVVTPEDGAIYFAIVATGAQTWNPSAQAGTNIANTDDGAHGCGEQYALQASAGSLTLNWTFGTSDDYGAVVAAFCEVPPRVLENYKGLRADSGMSVGEKVR